MYLLGQALMLPRTRWKKIYAKSPRGMGNGAMKGTTPRGDIGLSAEGKVSYGGVTEQK